MITTLIIEDEENNRAVLRTLLTAHCPTLLIVGEANCADDAFLKINKLKPQLIFLDIKMPQKSGFALLKMFTKINFEVIFVTAYDRYALQAFEFNALAYIIKPLNPAKLVKAVAKAEQHIHNKKNSDIVLHFVKTLSDKNELINKFSVHHNGKVIFVNVSEIAFIESKSENTTLNLYDNTHYHSAKDLGRFEDILQEIGSFIRINKSVLVNTSFVKSYSKGEVCVIELSSGQAFEVSRRRKTEILKRLKG